jgi:hypothetical protein
MYNPELYGPDVWELFELQYQEILDYEEEQKNAKTAV